MPGDHYFSSNPATELALRSITVRIGGVERRVTTANGIFSPDHIDTGTKVLLGIVPPPPPTGNFLDLGAGWGPISLELALASRDATVWAVDVNDRALDLVRRNAADLGITTIRASHPEAVPEDIQFDAIWSNPPIRVGKAELHSMLLQWLPRLAPGADAHLVVQRNLGSDSLQRWLGESLPSGFTVSLAGQSKGFRVIRVTRAGDDASTA